MSTDIPPLDIITGALLIGTWVSSLLYTFELREVFRYFRKFPKDEWYIKALVLNTVLIDTITTVANYAAVYLYTVTHAGDLVYLSRQNWTIPLLVFSTGFVAAQVQLFLIMRYWRFTNNTAFPLFLLLLIGTSTGACFATGITVARFPSYIQRHKARTSATLWVITQSLIDVLIAGALLWQFHRLRGGFKKTQNIIDRLALQAIQTGTATATVAVAALITYLVNNESNVPLGIAYVIFDNLNIRTFLQVPGNGVSQLSGSQSGDDNITQFQVARREGPAIIPGPVVHVHQRPGGDSSSNGDDGSEARTVSDSVCGRDVSPLAGKESDVGLVEDCAV
ncbi:hypothetical protein MIND_00917400 [Mycena indigotica]|uniref:DUF6534 domain-containing protein n=1 Tax=Mycena indigotica TaxID=2126181 RepID=A0A8H6SDR0_9AGAR|nr:uncharacterized protein MIND_00917400 [Mycena indigotica]KAF7296861.1 hypothetical protein MIND_00917400 [Mycena indigotica]